MIRRSEAISELDMNFGGSFSDSAAGEYPQSTVELIESAKLFDEFIQTDQNAPVGCFGNQDRRKTTNTAECLEVDRDFGPLLPQQLLSKPQDQQMTQMPMAQMRPQEHRKIPSDSRSAQMQLSRERYEDLLSSTTTGSETSYVSVCDERANSIAYPVQQHNVPYQERNLHGSTDKLLAIPYKSGAALLKRPKSMSRPNSTVNVALPGSPCQANNNLQTSWAQCRIKALEDEKLQIMRENEQMKQRIKILEREREAVRAFPGLGQANQQLHLSFSSGSHLRNADGKYNSKNLFWRPKEVGRGEVLLSSETTVLRHKNGRPVTKDEFIEIMSEACGTSANPFPRKKTHVAKPNNSLKNLAMNSDVEYWATFRDSARSFDDEWLNSNGLISETWDQGNGQDGGELFDTLNLKNKEEEDDELANEIMPREPEYLDCDQVWQTLQSKKAVLESFDMDEFCELLRLSVKCSVDGPVFLEKEVCQAVEHAGKLGKNE